MKKVIFLILAAFVSSSLISQTQPFEIMDDAPDFKIVNEDGNSQKLSKMVEKGPVLLTFYRGEWCKYCNQYLSELSDNLKRFNSYDTRIIAISPETNEYVNLMDEKIDGKIELIADNENSIMDAYKVSYQVKPEKLKSLLDADIDIEEYNGEGKTILPVPATYVIDRNMKIRFVHYEEDYTFRANLDEVFYTVRSLAGEKLMEAEMQLMFQAKKEMEEKQKANKQ